MPNKYESYPDTNYDVGADEQIVETIWIAQTFTPSVAHSITSVKLYTRRVGSPGDLTVSIRATDGSSKPTGSDLAVGTTNANSFSTSYAHNEITFTTPYSLTASTKYAIVARALTSIDPTDYVEWGYDGSSASYSGGGEVVSSNSGVTWGSEATTVDMIFEEWGNPTFIPKIFYF